MKNHIRKAQDVTWLSACCDAGVYTAGVVTSHFVCNKCGKVCDGYIKNGKVLKKSLLIEVMEKYERAWMMMTEEVKP